eukprot:853602_1
MSDIDYSLSSEESDSSLNAKYPFLNSICDHHNVKKKQMNENINERVVIVIETAEPKKNVQKKRRHRSDLEEETIGTPITRKKKLEAAKRKRIEAGERKRKQLEIQRAKRNEVEATKRNEKQLEIRRARRKKNSSNDLEEDIDASSSDAYGRDKMRALRLRPYRDSDLSDDSHYQPDCSDRCYYCYCCSISVTEILLYLFVLLVDVTSIATPFYTVYSGWILDGIWNKYSKDEINALCKDTYDPEFVAFHDDSDEPFGFLATWPMNMVMAGSAEICLILSIMCYFCLYKGLFYPWFFNRYDRRSESCWKGLAYTSAIAGAAFFTFYLAYFIFTMVFIEAVKRNCDPECMPYKATIDAFVWFYPMFIVEIVKASITLVILLSMCCRELVFPPNTRIIPLGRSHIDFKDAVQIMFLIPTRD